MARLAPSLEDAGPAAPLDDAELAAPLDDAGLAAPVEDAGPAAPLDDAGLAASLEGAGPAAPLMPAELAAALAGVLPGVVLAAQLAELDLTGVDDAALVEVVAGWRRVQSWAAGQAALAAAALSERSSMNPDWPEVAGRVGQPCVAAEELAMRLACSRRAAADLVAAGRAFEGVLWPTGEALLAGEIDEVKARVLLRGLRDVPGPVALDVQDQVLAQAARRTPAQLDGDVRRALITVDPDHAAQRAALAVAGRRVCRPKVLSDGMAGIWAVLPAPAAVALHHELGALAVAAQRMGDTRTVDQLRADALSCAVLARGRRGNAGQPTASGTAGAPGVSGIASGAVSGTSSTTREVGSSGGGRVADSDVLAQLLAGPTLDADLQVVVPLDALLGIADGAADLADYGPIIPATAEALARGGTWRRLVADPLSGTLLDVGRTRYRPPAGLAAHVRTRDGTCVRPGCPTIAARCEIDHTVPFGDLTDRDADPPGRATTDVAATADGVTPGGRTADANLGCLCKREHQLKTHAGFQLRQTAPGVFEWTTPTGHRYTERRTVDGPVPLEAGPAEPGPTSADGASDRPTVARLRPGEGGPSIASYLEQVAPFRRWDRLSQLDDRSNPPSPLLGWSGRRTEIRGPDGRTTESSRVILRPHFTSRSARRRRPAPPPF